MARKNQKQNVKEMKKLITKINGNSNTESMSSCVSIMKNIPHHLMWFWQCHTYKISFAV